MWGRTRRGEREILAHARKNAEEEATRIRVQAAADKLHRQIVEQAQRDAGLLPRKRSWAWYPFHVLANIGRGFLLQPSKPWNPER